MEIFILLALILLNGVFSMSEIALVSARKARLESQANKGNSQGERSPGSGQPPRHLFINRTNRYYLNWHFNRYLLRRKTDR